MYLPSILYLIFPLSLTNLKLGFITTIFVISSFEKEEEFVHTIRLV
jgi:hypothetical protein